MEQRHVVCGACRASVTMFVWHVIDAAQYPDLKRQLLADTVNVVPCPACGRRCRCDIPVRYDDPVLGFAVQFVPAAARSDFSFLQLCTEGGTLPSRSTDSASALGAERDAHVVFSMAEMIRYVVFRDRISDFARRTY